MLNVKEINIPKQAWTPKCPELMVLKSYSGKPPSDYWSSWAANRPSVISDIKSWIDPDKLRQLAEDLGYHRPQELSWACNILRHGANIGARGAGRLPYVGRNYPTSESEGHLLADSMNSWIKQNLCIGPYDSDKLPFPVIRINPMSVQPKPNGSGRIVMDFSAPHRDTHEVNIDSDTPISLNSSIDKSLFKSSGVSTIHVLKQLQYWGPGVYFSKMDWRDAYKHVKVHPDDLYLQGVSFMGKVFFETSLVFGTSSSPSIFDRMSNIPRTLACIIAAFKMEWTIKQLDDLIPFGRESDVKRYESEYNSICERLGIRLATDDGSAKTFTCSTEGSILGLEYNTMTWEWSFSHKKAAKMLIELKEIVEKSSVSIALLKSLIGRLEFYHQVMGKSARWERGFLIKAANESENLKHTVLCSTNVVSQALWWQRSITASLEYSMIPDPSSWLCQDVLHMYPDAAGGASQDTGRGLGVLMKFNDIVLWSFQSHSWMILNNDRAQDGSRLGSKLTFLEGAAALLGVSTMAEYISNKSCVIWSDNAGLTYAYAKGYSKCMYAYTVAKAIADLAKRLNAHIVIRKTPRRSGWQEECADDISKSQFSTARKSMGENNKFLFPPKTLTKFLMNPSPTRVLGVALAREISDKAAMLQEEPEVEEEVNKLYYKRKCEV